MVFPLLGVFFLKSFSFLIFFEQVPVCLGSSLSKLNLQQQVCEAALKICQF